MEDPIDQELKRVVLKAFHGEKAWPHAICDADVRENGEYYQHAHPFSADACNLYVHLSAVLADLDSCKFEPRTPGPFDRLAKSHVIRAEVKYCQIHEARLKLQAQPLYTIRHGKEHISRRSKI